MDKPHDKRLMSLLHSYEELAPAEREQFLDRECDGDENLRQEIELLIQERASSTEASVLSQDHVRVLPDHYRLIRIIGTGGMAKVYLAEDTRLNRRVAIKFLNDERQNHPEQMRRFSLEARAASALNHPNIITIYDIGETDGVQFIVTEYVEGETLGIRIRRGTIPLTETVDIAIQISSALDASHKAGIIHRDLKPDNIMLRPDGGVKVLDFGLAKARGNTLEQLADLEAKTLDGIATSPGLILGTPQYMSPEQTRALHLDGRTDIFSLGLIIFEMLTGKTAFAGNSTVDIIAAIIGKEPRRLEDYIDDPPANLVRTLEKTLRKDRDQRYLAMEHLLSDLKDLKVELANDSYFGPATRRAQVRETLNEPRPARRLGIWKWLIAASVLAILLSFTWWFSGIWSRNGAVSVAMRSVAITSWSSAAGESVTASAFSPDQKMVAFASTRSGATEIWIKQTVGGDPVQVTKNGSYNQYPVWSPNGQELVFFSRRADNNGLWRVAFTGGQELQIASGISASARLLSWLSDGKIYFQDGIDLFTIEERSGERKQLTNFAQEGIRPRAIAVSADGSTLAITLKEGDLWKVKTKRLDGGSFVEIVSSREQIENITCGSTGNTVFYSGMVDGTLQIFRAASGQSSPVQISNGNSDFSVQDISPDGSKILFSSVGETSDLWMIDSQDSKETPIANDVPSEYWPDVSADGKSVVFQSVSLPDRPFRGSIFIKPLTTTGSPTLVSPDGFSPTWSNDGQQIAFFRRGDIGFGIWKARPTGADATKLVDGSVNTFGYLGTPYLKQDISHLSWSPDDSLIAFSRTVDGMPNIWLTAADGTKTYALTSNKDPKEPYSSPVWAPDGKSIVFISDTVSLGEKVRRIWLVQMETSEQRQIYELKGTFVFQGLTADAKEAVIAERSDATDLSPTPASTNIFSVSLQTGNKKLITKLTDAYFHNIHMSPDGRNIAFVTRRNNITEVWTVPMIGGIPRKIIVENDPKVLFSSLTWSSDNRSIVLGKQTRTNLLSMLTN